MSDIFTFLKANAGVASAVSAMASAIIALVALVASFLAIRISGRTLSAQRAHNVLSVRPMPLVLTADNEDRITIALRNNGVGPMLIKTLQVEGGTAPRSFVRECLPALPDGLSWSTYAGKIDGYSLGVGEQVVLLELSGVEADPKYSAFRDECRRLLASLKIKITYSDVYGTSFAPHEQSLAWYGRERALKASIPAEGAPQ